MNYRIAFIVTALLLILSNGVWVATYISLEKNYTQTKVLADASSTNTKIVSFLDLFVKNLLQAKGEVDFETRLKLENAVRDINDSSIMTAWKSFIDSTSEKEAQSRTAQLLAALIGKIGSH